MTLTPAGILSGFMPAPEMGVVGWTKILVRGRAVRVAFWVRPGLLAGLVAVTTMGGNLSAAAGSSWARARPFPQNRHSNIDAKSSNRAPIRPIPFARLFWSAGWGMLGDRPMLDIGKDRS